VATQLQYTTHQPQWVITLTLGGATCKWNSIQAIGEAWIAGMQHTMVDNMKDIKPSINVKYIVEIKDLRSGWQEIGCSTRLEEAIKDIENEREMLPKQEFRLIRSEWEVIG
jgi:hypothetical protein